MFGFKKISLVVLAACGLFTASAVQAKPADCKARDVRVECWLKDEPAASTNQRAVNNQEAAAPATSGFREPTSATPEQVLLATSFSQAAFRQCMEEVRRDENRRAWNETGQQVGIILADRLTRGNSYGGYYGGNYRYNNGGNQSLQSCEQVRDRTYADMLHATPASYCDESMEGEYRRGGQPVTEERMRRRCQARTTNTSWNTGFQPQN